MKKKIIIGIAVTIIALMIGLYLYVRPTVSNYELVMPGVKMDESGEILCQGEIKICGKAIHTRFQPTYIVPEKVELVDLSDLSPAEDASVMHLYDVLISFMDYAKISGKLHSETVGDFVFTGHVYEEEYCVLEIQHPDGVWYVAGSTQYKTDWEAYLDRYLADVD